MDACPYTVDNKTTYDSDYFCRTCKDLGLYTDTTSCVERCSGCLYITDSTLLQCINCKSISKVKSGIVCVDTCPTGESPDSACNTCTSDKGYSTGIGKINL